MTKRKSKQREQARKKAANQRLGHCHGCGAPWTKLTYEHVPPLRVQALIPENFLRFNPFGDAVIRSASGPKRRLPPCTVAHGGLRVKSFGECCQQLTQRYYGQAFFDWSRLALKMCELLTGTEDRVQAVVRINPLAVIKQIASMALAASEYHENRAVRRLRGFIQDPEQTGVPEDFDFYAYLNPLRPTYELPQCRLARRTVAIHNINTREQAMIFAEISVPPLGYVALYRTAANLDAAVRPLMPINHFGTTGLAEIHQVALNLPIRTPFGPMPLQYSQDAENERVRVGHAAVVA